MDELRKYAAMLNRRKLSALIAFLVVLTLTAVIANRRKTVYQASSQILIQPTDTTSSLVGGAIGELREATNKNNLNTEMVMLRSTTVAQRAIHRLQLKGVSPEAFLAPMSVRRLPDTNVLEVSYQGSDPHFVADVVNTLVKVYMDMRIDNDRAALRSAQEFIDRQVPLLEKAVRKAEADLRQFKDRNQIFDASTQAQAVLKQMDTLSGEIQKTQAELSSVQANVTNLQNLVGMDVQTAVIVSSPWVQEVLVELQKVEQLITVERTRFQDRAPNLQLLLEKQAVLQRLLQQRLAESLGVQPSLSGRFQMSAAQQQLVSNFVDAEVSRLSLESRLNTLQGLHAQVSQQVRQLPRLEQQQRELERHLQTAQATYESLRGRLQELRIAENQITGHVQVVTPASTGFEVNSRRQNDLMRGAVLAAIVALLLAYILDSLDRSIKTPEEAKALTGYPLLGIIPNFQHNAHTSRFHLGSLNLNQLTREQLHRHQNGRPSEGFQPTLTSTIVVKDLPSSRASEAFRSLHTNLKFLNLDRMLKSIVVTSSVPKEGKSTIAANLAVSIAQLGRKVLLIDADMRNPSQHQIWELPNVRGLSNVVTGQVKFHLALHSLMPNLHLLTAGMSPPNPVAILDSHRMADLVTSLTAHYDLIIIDSPPVTVAADAALLGKVADGLLLLVRPGISDSHTFTFTQQQLEQTGQNVLGIVVNGIVPDVDPYYGYYYGYGQAHQHHEHPEAELGAETEETPVLHRHPHHRNGHHPENHS